MGSSSYPPSEVIFKNRSGSNLSGFGYTSGSWPMDLFHNMRPFIIQRRQGGKRHQTFPRMKDPFGMK